MTDDDATITITLSDRSPVKIIARHWPLIAQAEWADDTTVIRERSSQTVTSRPGRSAHIRVREHADGRRLVYGWSTMQWKPERSDAAAGFLIEKDVNAARAIRRVAGVIGRNELADDCIADLPAEEI